MAFCFSVLKKKIGRISLAKQLIFAISLMMFCVLSAVIGFSYQRTIQVINRQQSASSLEILNLKRRNFETYFDQLENYSMLLRYNSRIYSIISSDKPLNYTDSSYVKSVLRDTFYSRNDIDSYQLYLLDNRVCYSMTKSGFNIRTSSFDSPQEDSLFQKARTAKNYLCYQPESGKTGRLLTLCRVYINIVNQRPLAFLKITVDDSFLRNLSDNSGGISSILGVMDLGGNLYYTADSGVLNYSSLSEMESEFSAAGLSGSFSARLADKDYLSVYSDSPDGRWRFLSLISKDVLQKATVQTRNLSLILAFLAFLVSAGLIFIMTKTQLKPLRKLAHQMQRVGKGDFTVRVNSGGNAEVNDLSHQFNLMNIHIEDLIQKNYIAELNEKTARLEALEAQINPHFLYNTLQVISTEAVLSGQQTIRQMVESLASMLRYSVQERNLVPARMEIKHVKDYLFLQSARFEARLTYMIDMDPDSEEILIPKISIQVLVENSIQHGLENTTGQICIAVKIQKEGGFLHLSVTDNGRGMTAERLKEIRSMTEPNRADGRGIGLTNLASRLKILYGGKASLSIQSSPDSGTAVELYIPVEKEGEQGVSFPNY